jgi:hypothetical protein
MTEKRSHTAKYAVGIDRIHPSQHGAYLKARSAVYHPDRSVKGAGGSQIFWSAPSRRWLKVYAGSPDVEVIEHHVTCPCSMT